MTLLKPIPNIVITEDFIDFIQPDEGIILLTRAWAQYGDNILNLPKKSWNTYLILKKLLTKTEGRKSFILRNRLKKYMNLKLKEKSKDVLFYIPPNGDFGFSKIKREDLRCDISGNLTDQGKDDLKLKLNVDSFEALKVCLCQFQVPDDKWPQLKTKDQIINFIVENLL
jgi:hypothetical protein